MKTIHKHRLNINTDVQDMYIACNQALMSTDSTAAMLIRDMLRRRLGSTKEHSYHGTIPTLVAERTDIVRYPIHGFRLIWIKRLDSCRPS